MFNNFFIDWYVPHPIPAERDWIPILIFKPVKNPKTPSSLKIVKEVSKILRYLIEGSFWVYKENFIIF